MSGNLVELHALLSRVRRRWTERSLLRAWTLGAAISATVLLSGLGAIWLVAADGLPLVVTAAIISILSLGVLFRTFWPFRRQPSDARLARYVEEKAGDLEDVLVTAVDYAERPDGSAQMREWLAGDAVAALATFNLDRVVSTASIRQAALRAAVATAALVTAAVLIAPSFGRAAGVAAAYLFPANVVVEVTPGSTKVRAGNPITITARIAGFDGALVPTLRIVMGQQARRIEMSRGAESGVFNVTIDKVDAPFAYSVLAAQTRSDEYAVSVIRPPRVERIDVRYEFPQGLGLEPRVDQDSGDIFGPAGTKVRLTISADKPIARAQLVLADGTQIQLSNNSQVLDGGLTIEEDTSYRVALADVDGLENDGETEYFIRTLDDRPPDVRIIKPVGDSQVTPLEEVRIEARADDDYGVAALDLVFQTPAGKERVVPLRGTGGLTAAAAHTLFMEDLRVQPGDFVTYFARARDVGRGRRAAEARSDIYFLEVKPFEEEFVAAQSQAMGAGGGANAMTGLAEAQKDIIVATWKLDARARRARDARSTEDIKAIAKAQSELKARAEQASGDVARAAGDPRRRRSGAAAPGDNPIGKAIEAMGRAFVELDKVDTSAALPHEMEALNQLLKAEAEIRRRQVSRQQQAGGGGGGENRSQADLSSLFDQELRKRQETNYETPTTSEQRAEEKKDDPLEKIRELARRQDALNRQQRDLAKNREQLAEEELKRQLERLTREQNELRREAEQLARGMQSGRQQSQSGNQSSSGDSQQESRRMREISEEMRNAATELGRQNPQQASERGNRVAERLRELEQQMQGARPDDRRRALGDLQLETRQLADAQRRVANESARTAQGQAGEDARRRLAGEQERLAERAERLRDNVKRLSRTGNEDERRATEDAARELDGQKLAERMRQSADIIRQSGEQGRNGQNGDANGAREGARQAARQGEELARSLDRVAERLGAASGSQTTDARKLSDQLSKTQQLRDSIADAERSMEELRRLARQGEQGAAGEKNQQGQGQQNQQGQNQQGQQSQGQRQGQQGQNGQASDRSQSGQQPGNGGEGSNGGQGGDGGRGRLEQLQREVNERVRNAERLAQEFTQQNPGLGANTPESWWRSVSAPGTEASKQDFARWESLKQNLLVALEQVESKLSDELRVQENKERLNAGGHAGVSDAYRELVDKYYRSLAAPRKPQ